MKMEQTECSETSAYKIQTRENYAKENIQQTITCFYTLIHMSKELQCSLGKKTPQIWTFHIFVTGKILRVTEWLVPDVSRQRIFLRFNGRVFNADGLTKRPLCHLVKSGTHYTVTLSHDPKERRHLLIHCGNSALAHNTFLSLTLRSL